MSIFTIRPSAVCAAAVLAMASVGAQAASISFDAQFGAAPTDWTASLGLGKFDSNLGTLTSITFTLDGTVTGEGKVENKGTAATTVGLDLASVLTLSRPDLTPLVATNPVFSQSGIQLGAADGKVDFAGVSAYSTGPVSVSLANSKTYTSASDFALFTQAGGGTINLGMSAVGASKSTGSGNVANDFTTNALGKAKVTYNYTAAVPEPESYALMLAGLGLMGAVARRRRAAR